MFVAGLAVIHAYEVAGNPALGLGANMEGKEQRFGAMLSALWAASATAASNGSVNAMHDSFMPLSGLVMLVFMQIGEVIFGGVGAGLYGMLLYVVLAVFLAGLMVGRAPEYLGRKIEGHEVTLAMPAFLSIPLNILVAATVPQALAAVQDAGPHGMSEILRLFVSDREQRQRLRRLWRRVDLAHDRARDHHAIGALRHHHPDAGDCRVDDPQDAVACHIGHAG